MLRNHPPVDPLPQPLSLLEVRGIPRWHCIGFAGLRVTPDTGRAGMQGEAAEPPDLDPAVRLSARSSLTLSAQTPA